MTSFMLETMTFIHIYTVYITIVTECLVLALIERHLLLLYLT